MELKKLIIHNLKTGSNSMFIPFMLSTIEEWKEAPLSLWEAILDEIKDKPLSLYLYLPFTYKFLGIDLIIRFYNLKDISKDTLTYINDSLSDKNHWLYLFQSEINMIIRQNGSIFNDLILIKESLTNQGATPVHSLFISNDSPIEIIRDTFF